MAGALGLAIGCLVFVLSYDGPRVIASYPELAGLGGPFELTDMTGRAVTDATYRGKWLIVFFGYTTCPDVCPTVLSEIGEALGNLGPVADRLQPLFITIDPRRDTPAVLAQYVAAFDGHIVGLTGSPAQIAAVAKRYRAGYAEHRSPEAPDGYYMDHTSVVYVMSPDGRCVATFSHETPAARLAERLRKLVTPSS
jgi:protein SCO1